MRVQVLSNGSHQNHKQKSLWNVIMKAVLCHKLLIWVSYSRTNIKLPIEFDKITTYISFLKWINKFIHMRQILCCTAAWIPELSTKLLFWHFAILLSSYSLHTKFIWFHNLFCGHLGVHRPYLGISDLNGSKMYYLWRSSLKFFWPFFVSSSISIKISF